MSDRSRNDELVKDADKLWRYSTTGVAVGCDFFGLTPVEYADHVEREIAATRQAQRLES